MIYSQLWAQLTPLYDTQMIIGDTMYYAGESATALAICLEHEKRISNWCTLHISIKHT